MDMTRNGFIVAGLVAWMALVAVGGETVADEASRNGLAFSNGAGVQRTITSAGSFDPDNPFFQSLGTNGRTCFTCHQPDQG
jgi:cytochrome c peroxidase